MVNATLLTVGAALLELILLAVAYHYTMEDESNRGRAYKPHAIYGGVAILVMVLLPTDIGRYFFSSLSVTVVATCFPIYESVRGVCTPGEDDDKKWLQYWMAGGVLFMATGWVDDTILKDKPDAMVHWYEFCFFVFVWLYFPSTSGAALKYDFVTEPYISPRLRPLQKKMDNAITAAIQLLTNAAHLWFVWLIFIFLPGGLKRIIAVVLGTVYPLVSSITAASTEDVEDDTVWLTYWACYGCLFLIMECLEVYLGWLPGFYTLVIFCTIYLMLPMFQGADKVFRKVLVPLTGLQEMLMLRDAIVLKKGMLRDLDPERATKVRKAIAKFYDDDNIGGDGLDAGALKQEMLSSWEGVRGIKMPALPKFSLPFLGKKDDESGEPGENTSLVV